MRYSVCNTMLVDFDSAKTELEMLRDASKESGIYPISIERDGNRVDMKMSSSVLGTDTVSMIIDGGKLDKEFLESPETTEKGILDKIIIQIILFGRRYTMKATEMAKFNLLSVNDPRDYPNKEELKNWSDYYITAVTNEEIELAMTR